MSTFSAQKPPEAVPPRAENESYSEISQNVNFFRMDAYEADKAHACPQLWFRSVLLSCTRINAGDIGGGRHM